MLFNFNSIETNQIAPTFQKPKLLKKNTFMNILRSWREQKIMLKRRFPVLEDQDFDFQEGSRETMLDWLSKKLVKTRPELDQILADLQLY